MIYDVCSVMFDGKSDVRKILSQAPSRKYVE